MYNGWLTGQATVGDLGAAFQAEKGKGAELTHALQTLVRHAVAVGEVEGRHACDGAHGADACDNQS